MISLTLGGSSVGLAFLIIAWRCTALPKIIAPRVRRKRKTVEITESIIEQAIQMAPANPTEDLDPDMVINPIQLRLIEERKKAKAEAKRKAHLAKLKAAKEAAGAGGVVPAAARGGGGGRGSLSKLGINIVHAPPPPPGGGSHPEKHIGIDQIDVHLRVEAAEQAKEREKAEAEEAARTAEEAAKAKPARCSFAFLNMSTRASRQKDLSSTRGAHLTSSRRAELGASSRGTDRDTTGGMPRASQSMFQRRSLTTRSPACGPVPE
jgi:hypothetical protein